MNKKNILLIFIPMLLISLLINIIALLSPGFYFFNKEIPLTETQVQELTKQGKISLQSLDVPVSSLLLYQDSIIGKGHNDVIRNRHAGGHAEINAISDAIQNVGFKTFKTLDRDKLILITTFEPCAMCRGAILEYNIQKVGFMKSKNMVHWTKEMFKQWRYEWNKYPTDHRSLQDSLFMQFPGYRSSQ